MGSSAGAIQSIWKKLSMNDRVRTPSPSARRARSVTPGPMPDGDPAQSKRDTCRSRFMAPVLSPERGHRFRHREAVLVDRLADDDALERERCERAEVVERADAAAGDDRD